MTNTLIIDTCVLLDIFIPSRPRHSVAKVLAQKLKENAIVIRIPITSFFELSSAKKNINILANTPVPFDEYFSEANGLKIELIALDEKFMEDYLNISLPYLKANDL